MDQAPARQRAEIALLAGALLLLLPGLGATDLWAPDEPRYAQIAEELRSFEHGARGLLLLHLNGEVYTQKPPLYFWLAGALGAPLGRVSETIARLPSALAGVALVALTLGFGRRLLGARTGLLGAALLLTSFEFAWLARRVQLDVLLALWETLALAAFWRIDRGIGSRRRTLAGMHLALGLAVLTKGPVGFLVPLLVMATTLQLRGRLRTLPALLPPWGLALSLGPGLAWLAAAVSLAPPGYFEEAVGTNVLGRFFAGTSHARPFYYYFYQLPVDFLPWTLLLPAVYGVGRGILARKRSGDPEAAAAWRFLLAWVGASFVFFSLSGGKRGLYLLPAFPALALLCADTWLRLLERGRGSPRALGWAFGVAAALLALAGATGALSPLLPQIPQPDVRPGWLVAAGLAMIASVATAVVAWHRWDAAASRIGIPVATAFAVELAILLLVLPGLDPGKSPRPVALAAAKLAGTDGAVGLLGNRAMAGGLVYYGGRRVEQLATPEDVDRFLRAGGRAVVARAKHLDWVRSAATVEVLARFREGDRGLHVLSAPRPGGTSQASAPPADP